MLMPALFINPLDLQKVFALLYSPQLWHPVKEINEKACIGLHPEQLLCTRRKTISHIGKRIHDTVNDYISEESLVLDS